MWPFGIGRSDPSAAELTRRLSDYLEQAPAGNAVGNQRDPSAAASPVQPQAAPDPTVARTGPPLMHWQRWTDLRPYIEKAAEPITDIPREVYQTTADQLSSIGENLNPFSEKRQELLRYSRKLRIWVINPDSWWQRGRSAETAAPTSNPLGER